MPLSSESIGCEQVIERLEPWIDGDLDEGLAQRVRRHIDGCPSCRAESRLAEQVKDQLAGMPVFDLPSRVLDAVRKETEGGSQEDSVTGWKPRWVSRPAAAALIGAMALVVVVIVTGRQPRQRQPTNAEVESVAAETRLALAYLGDVARRVESKTAAHLAGERAAISRITEMSKTLSRALDGDAEKPTNEGIEGSSR